MSRIYKLMEDGSLPSFLIGGRRKIPLQAITRLIAEKSAEPMRPRVMPWDRDGTGQRQHHPRREDAPESGKRQQARAEAVEVRRGPGRPRKAQPNDKAAR